MRHFHASRGLLFPSNLSASLTRGECTTVLLPTSTCAPFLLPLKTWSGSEFPEIIALRIEGISWGIGLGESGEVAASDGADMKTAHHHLPGSVSISPPSPPVYALCGGTENVGQLRPASQRACLPAVAKNGILTAFVSNCQLMGWVDGGTTLKENCTATSGCFGASERPRRAMDNG